MPAALFFFALLLRLAGIGWGLPQEDRYYSYHPDEPIVMAVSQQIEPSKGDFAPSFYNYGTLYLTVARVSSDLAGAYGANPNEGGAAELRWVRLSHLLSRVASALAGAGTVLFVFLILRRFTGLFGSIAGAAWVLVAPAHVVHSRFMTVDVMSAFLLTVSIWFAIRRMDWREEAGPSWKPALWCGVFAGLSAGTKYTGILALVCLFVVLAFGKRFLWRDGAIAMVASIAAFVVSTPGALLETEAFARDVRYEMFHTATGHGLVFQNYPGFLFDFTNLLSGAGLFMTLLGLGGLVYGCVARKPWALALAAFALAHFVLIGRGDVHFLRYTFPLYIPLAAGFGWLVQSAHDRSGWWRGLVALAILGLGGLLDGAGLVRAVTFTGYMMEGDPRDSAAAYLRDKGGTVGLVSRPWFYTPPLYPLATAGPYVPWPLRLEAMRESKPPVGFYVPENPDEAFDWDVRLLNEVRPDRVVFSSFEMEDVDRLQSARGLPGEVQVQVDRYAAFLARLNQDYAVEATFGRAGPLVHDLEYIQPRIWIWKRRSSD